MKKEDHFKVSELPIEVKWWHHLRVFSIFGSLYKLNPLPKHIRSHVLDFLNAEDLMVRMDEYWLVFLSLSRNEYIENWRVNKYYGYASGINIIKGVNQEMNMKFHEVNPGHSIRVAVSVIEDAVREAESMKVVEKLNEV